MFKKLSILFLCLILLTLTACSGKNGKTEVSTSEPEPSSVTPTYYQNPLTGEVNLSLELSKQQPTAVMINNISIAQKVQTGVGDADIVYETEVEGGITRLMAVYQNIQNAGTIGTIRSARYVYVDLALGHDAIYLHHGQDPIYCAPHLKHIEHYTVGTNNCGVRKSNGLSSEHTLYTEGSKVFSTFVKAENSKERKSWQKFADEDKSLTLTGGACTELNVPFSSTYNTGFKYNATTGLYTRYFRGNVVKDYVTGKTTDVKNVFVLFTSITNYPDGKHKNVALTGGKGYYVVNGTYKEINWKKGSSTSPLVFTNTDGSPLEVNVGNSWVCLAKSNINLTILPAAQPETTEG